MGQFSVGQYRAINLWGGTGTRRMLKLTFPHLSIDDKNFDIAHSIEGAEHIAAMGFNWVFLTFSWGFPPEIEEQDWELFRSAVKYYHDAGIRVFGYIQASNCVYQGSYINKDWYALDPYNNKINCYIGRYYTSLLNPEWQAEVRRLIRTLVETEADGIFFDNPWLGGVGYDVSEMPMGPIGSYDEHSKLAYAQAYDGAEIPLVLDTRSLDSQQYLRWRTQVASRVIEKWVEVAKNLNPNIVISANNFDAIARNSYVSMGMDLGGLTDVQDLGIIENFAFPQVLDNGAVVSNAITIGAAQARTGEIPITTKPSTNAVGFERMWLPNEIRRAFAESLAMKAPMIFQGIGFRYYKEVTLLFNSRYRKQQESLTAINEWFESNQAWLQAREASSPLAIYHPYEAIRWEWSRIAPIFFAACESVILNGYPLRIVGDDDDWKEVQTLLVPPGEVDGLNERLQAFIGDGGTIIPLVTKRSVVGNRVLWDGWRPLRSRIPRWRWIRRQLNHGAMISWRLYHHFRVARWIANRLRIQEAMIRSSMYFVPPQPFQRVLVGELGDNFYPRVESESPILFTCWREPDGTQQLHVVNYSNTTQRITVHLGDLMDAQVYTPGSDVSATRVVGSSLMLNVEVAKVIRASRPTT